MKKNKTTEPANDEWFEEYEQDDVWPEEYDQNDVWLEEYDQEDEASAEDARKEAEDYFEILDDILEGGFYERTEEEDDDNPLIEASRKELVTPPDINKFRIDTMNQITRDTDLLRSKLSDMDFELSVIDDAIYVLIGESCGSPTIYDQLAITTKECLLQQGFLKDNVDMRIQWYRESYISSYRVEKSILSYILNIYKDSSVRDKVSILPLMCGMGKSTSITQLIIRTIKRVEAAKTGKLQTWLENIDKPIAYDPYDGLLVVTDSIERLKTLWNPRNDWSERDNNFIRTHLDGWVTVMTEENSLDAEAEQKTTPVLLVTTQRYFNWNRKEISDHLQWGENYRRPLIIFDEMPYLNEVNDISVKTLNDIDSALWLGLDDDVEQNDKMWCIEQWEKFRTRFIDDLYFFECSRDADRFYYEPQNKTISDNDDRFIEIVEKYKGKIRKGFSQQYHDIYAIKVLMNSWGIYSHRDIGTGAYENKIVVYVDNREKLTNLGSKVIVLDGTGDISPIYDGQDYVRIHKGTRFIRSLSYLTIKLCDYGTSRYDFYIDRGRIPPHIKEYLKADGNKLDDMYYFTYKKRRGKFHNDTKHTAHFGDIKGKNEFMETKTISQVGLNSLQPPQYLAHVIARNDDLRLSLTGKTHKETEEILERITESDEYNEFRAKHILADVDQCLFRSAIRTANNTEKVTYYLFFKQNTNSLLRKKVYERYKWQLGANIVPVGSAEIEEAWARQSGRANDKIMIWSKEWDGTPIKKKVVMDQLGVKESTFDSTIRRNEKLKELFAQFKKNAKDLGWPNGYYAKVVQKS